MGAQSAASGSALADLAARQHGVVTAGQLRAAGVGRESIRRLTHANRLHRLHRDVYAVGYRNRSQETRWMAAILACRGREGQVSEPAYLSHMSAAALWGLLPPKPGPVDVAVIGENGRTPREGIRIHRPRTLEVGMTAERFGIPLTDSRRTISDLRRAKPAKGGATPAQLRRAMRQAAVLGLDFAVDSAVGRTRSDLELRFLRLCRRHGLPRPEVNVSIDSIEVDFLWRERRLIVETDGYRYHRGPVAFETDRERDLRLRGLGFEVIRISGKQVAMDPAGVANTLRRVLAAD